MTVKRQMLGRQGEAIAAKYLQSKGYKIIIKNFRCPLGEIDLVAREGETTVFVEVRSRSTGTFGSPQESVGIKKQNKLRKLAQYYMAKYGVSGGCRFDVLGIKFESEGQVKNIEHFRNAF